MKKTASELVTEKLKAGGVKDARVYLYVIAEGLGFSPEDAAAEWIDDCFESDDQNLAKEVDDTIAACSKNGAICHGQENMGETMSKEHNQGNLFPIFDRGDMPFVEVSDLKEEIEAMVASGEEIPYSAFVSGPELNLRIEFNDYDPERHKPFVAMGLMGLIKRGATRIVVLANVWLKEENGVPTGDGIMILEATSGGETAHLARCVGEKQLGEWITNSFEGDGNLAGLFERADSLDHS